MCHQAHQCCSLQGAGYSSGPRGRFDPLNQAATGRAITPLAKAEEASPDEQCRDAEAKVHVALDESAQALRAQDASTGEMCRASGVPRCWHTHPNGSGLAIMHVVLSKTDQVLQAQDALTGLGCAGLHAPKKALAHKIFEVRPCQVPGSQRRGCIGCAAA